MDPRKDGHGRRLIQMISGWALQKGFEELRLNSVQSKTAFYRHLGFQSGFGTYGNLTIMKRNLLTNNF